MARSDDSRDRTATRFHGRVEGAAPHCAVPGCEAPGEFRAPPEGGAAGGDAPRAWRWLCLEHVRAFNAKYNYFAGMSPDEIEAEQRPYAGWERETRAFAANGSPGPRWADFADPLDAIGARFGQPAAAERKDGRPLSGDDRRAMKVLGLATDADRQALRRRYTELVRLYHPDRNGGDRSHEHKLREVIAAYDRLKAAPAFA